MHRSKKQLYTRLACVSACEIDGEKWHKCKKTMNGASICERSPTLGKETLPVGLEQGPGNAGIFLLSCDCLRQPPKTPTTTGLSSLLPTSFTYLNKIGYFGFPGDVVQQK